MSSNLPCAIFKGAQKGFKIKTSINCSPKGKDFARLIAGTLESWGSYFKKDAKTLALLYMLIEAPFAKWPKDTFIKLTLKKAIRGATMLDEICELFAEGHGQIQVI